MSQEKNPLPCPICDGTGWKWETINGYEYVKSCECQRKRAKLNYFGEKFIDSTLDNYIEKNKSMRTARQALLRKPDGSFFIYGAVNLGKTHLLAAFYEYQYKFKAKRIRVFKEATLKYELQHSSVGSYGWREKPKAVVSEMLEDCDAVFIDDISAGITEINDKNMNKVSMEEKYLESLYVFYDTIYERKLQLVVSSNFSLEESERIYGARIVSRIERVCEVIEINGDADDMFTADPQV